MAKTFKLPSKEEMLTRFWELKKAVDAAEAVTATMREDYEPAWNEAQEARKAAIASIRKVEADVIDGLNMFDAKQDMATLARALGHFVGTDPDLEPEPEAT